jgi:hypothetical protein
MRTDSSLAPRSAYAVQASKDLQAVVSILQAKNTTPDITGWPYFQIPSRHVVAASVASTATLAMIERNKKAS